MGLARAWVVSAKEEINMLERESYKNDEFLQAGRIERYRFVLSELTRLSENTHRHTRYLLTVFPTVSSAIIALKFGEKGLDIRMASKIAGVILVMFSVVSFFVIISVISDIASWFDYRNEEVKLINMMGGDFRKAPKIKNLWRWYETYLIGFVLFFVMIGWSIYFYLFIL